MSEDMIINSDDYQELVRLRERNEKLVAFLEEAEAKEKTPIRINGKTYAFTYTLAIRDAIGLPKGD